jgi:hypothetical protein
MTDTEAVRDPKLPGCVLTKLGILLTVRNVLHNNGGWAFNIMVNDVNEKSTGNCASDYWEVEAGGTSSAPLSSSTGIQNNGGILFLQY